MNRSVLSVTAILLALAGCVPPPEPYSNATRKPAVPAGNGDLLQPVQESGKPEITADRIAADLVGRVVQVSGLRGSGPQTEWTFEADEFRRVEILEKHMAERELTLVIFMTTRNNPGPGEDHVEVSGKLQLQYGRRAGKWILAGIQNLTFRYTVGLST